MHFTTAEKSKNHSFSFVKDELKRQNRWSHKSVKKTLPCRVPIAVFSTLSSNVMALKVYHILETTYWRIDAPLRRKIDYPFLHMMHIKNDIWLQ